MSLVVESPQTLSALFSTRAMELNLQAHDCAGVLLELLCKVPALAKDTERKRNVLQALLEREKLCSTGLGHGVALPHTRHSFADLSSEPLIVFGRHLEGVPYGAVDGMPVRLFFLLMSPTINLHLQFLSRLSRLVRQEELRDELLRVSDPEQVIELIGQTEATLLEK